MSSDRQNRDRTWRAAAILTLILAAGPTLAHAQQPAADHWLGKRVVQRTTIFRFVSTARPCCAAAWRFISTASSAGMAIKLWLEGEDDGPQRLGRRRSVCPRRRRSRLSGRPHPRPSRRRVLLCAPGGDP